MSDQEALPGLEVAAPAAGYLQRLVKESVEAAALDDRDKALAGAAEAAARAVDLAQKQGNVFAITAATRELRETLRQLGLDPSAPSRTASVGDAAEKFLAELGPS